MVLSEHALQRIRADHLAAGHGRWRGSEGLLMQFARARGARIGVLIDVVAQAGEAETLCDVEVLCGSG